MHVTEMLLFYTVSHYIKVLSPSVSYSVFLYCVSSAINMNFIMVVDKFASIDICQG